MTYASRLDSAVRALPSPRSPARRRGMRRILRSPRLQEQVYFAELARHGIVTTTAPEFVEAPLAALDAVTDRAVMGHRLDARDRRFLAGWVAAAGTW